MMIFIGNKPANEPIGITNNPTGTYSVFSDNYDFGQRILPPPSELRITDSGEYRITDSGDYRITD